MENKKQIQANIKETSTATKLGWVSFFNDCSSEAISRTLPLLLTASLGMSPLFVGIIEGVAETLGIFLKGFSGWLSDKMTSRKPLVIIGYVSSFFSRLALLVIYLPIFFALARILDRIGKGLRTAPRDAMIADAAAISKSAGHVFGITRFLDTLGAVTGLCVVLICGVGSSQFDLDTFKNIVYISIPFAIISLCLLIFWVKNVPRVIKSKSYISFSIPKEIRTYLAIVFVFTLANSSDAFLILKAKEIGFSFQQILIIFIFFNLIAALLTIPIGKLSDKFGRIRFLAIGWFIYGLSYVCIGLSLSKDLFIISILLYGMFYGFTEGIEKALLSDLLPAEKRGTGFGALQLILGLAALPASFLMGFLMTKYGSPIAFIVSASFAFTGMIMLIIWRFKKRLIF
ncbi:MFS transporter [Fluviispira multicolorata]|uniref:MFS transporter n=1 Tax=Fluviispira multicolorata TaxID=2654512 RepID=A0A833JFB8_9BACT|nr:MFS transporter [Fluviispira multicolorata]KAB8033630.1 MFS transporter [Fluviispira multicolorata]